MKYVGALDQGTTSTRFIIFDEMGKICSSHQIEHQQIYPNPGWVEHDPKEIWQNTLEVMNQAIQKASLVPNDIVGIGITNQRETIIAWDRNTGEIYYNAIVWQDLRGTEIVERLKNKISAADLQRLTGLVHSPYFSASKIVWMLENVAGLREKAEAGTVVFGTIDTWLVWNLTDGAVVTDTTNASRYLLMNLETCQWDNHLLEIFDIPRSSLPEIVPSMGEIYGYTANIPFLDYAIPICGILGDQQAALFGQACFNPGEGKSTYGTGCFLLVNTGTDICYSDRGLLTTVAFQQADEEPRFALEGSIAVAGSLVQWVRDNLKLVQSAPELDRLAETVADCGGVYIVPAFSGLFAPHWRSDARGVIAGLTGYATNAHICRATLEATAFQVKEIFDLMQQESGTQMVALKVDGGLTNSNPLMKFQADLLNVPIILPLIVETTALGAAYAAGITMKVWSSFGDLKKQWEIGKEWLPDMGDDERQEKTSFWNKAVERTLGWV